ncbi:MAG: class I SAM-dependent methyltransferase [Caldilineales bacterium]|nr:class I SAM-dependent methyltransferase [Caldilineales bacterium]
MLNLLKRANRALARRSDYHIGNAIRTGWWRRTLFPLLAGDPKRVLDAGSGAGQHTLELAAHFPTAQILGLDNRPEAVAQAQSKADLRGLRNVHFAVADLSRPLAAGDFDLIYSIDVIEHIPADQAMLDALAQALRPGGRLFIHTPLAPQKHFFRRFDLDRNTNPLHARAGYARGELEAKAAAAGLTAIDPLYTHGRAGTLAWELWQLVRPWAPPKLLIWPLLKLLVAWETRRRHTDGNCIFLCAQKAAIGDS